MTTVHLLPAERHQQIVLENLWQLYIHDFSDFVTGFEQVDVDERGLFPLEFDFRHYWEQPGFWPYLGWVGGRIAGFVLVSDRTHFRKGPGRYVDEFFVLRRYRRRGIGRSLAFQTFDTYRGYWEVAEIPGNLPAQAFWRAVIGEYTEGRYEEIVTPEGEVWQTFDSSRWTSSPAPPKRNRA